MEKFSLSTAYIDVNIWDNKNNNNNKLHLYLASAIFQSIIRKLNSLSIEALTAKPS